MSRLHPAGVAGFALGVGALIGAAVEGLRSGGTDYWQTRALQAEQEVDFLQADLDETEKHRAYWQRRADQEKTLGIDTARARDEAKDAAYALSWDLQHWQQRAGKAERAEAELVEVLARVAEAESTPRVQGRCPRCLGESLFLGLGGFLTCSRMDCPDPEAPTKALVP